MQNSEQDNSPLSPSNAQPVSTPPSAENTVDSQETTPTPFPSANEVPPSETPPTPPTEPVSPPEKPRRSSLYYLITLILFIVGIALGFSLFKLMPAESKKIAPQKEATADTLTLPSDAVQIQECASHKGTLYIRPTDIPVGPVYMVHKGKVIGLEFMLGKDEFLQGKNYENLQGLGMKVDHVSIGLLSQGHEGYTAPHYHVDFYNVSREIKDAITCPTNANSPTTPSSSSSATPNATPSSTMTPSSPSGAMQTEPHMAH